MLGIEHRITSAYHPQTNGLDENTNKNIKRALAKLVEENQGNWEDHLGGVLFSLRTKKQMTTKYSPFFLMYHREALFPLELPVEDVVNPGEFPSAEELIEREQKVVEACSNIKEIVLENINKAQLKQKKGYIARKKTAKSNETICPGKLVLRYNARKRDRKGHPFQPNYFGPYTVVSMKGKVVTLKDKDGLTLKKKYNVEHLKLYKEPGSTNKAYDSVVDDSDSDTLGSWVHVEGVDVIHDENDGFDNHDEGPNSNSEGIHFEDSVSNSNGTPLPEFLDDHGFDDFKPSTDPEDINLQDSVSNSNASLLPEFPDDCGFEKVDDLGPYDDSEDIKCKEDAGEGSRVADVDQEHIIADGDTESRSFEDDDIDHIDILNQVATDTWKNGPKGYMLGNIGKVLISDTTIACLKPTAWLDDEALDASFQVLASNSQKKVHVISSLVMTAMLDGKRCTPLLPRKFPSDIDVILGAYNERNVHWTLLFVVPSEGKIIYLNSMGETPTMRKRLLRIWKTDTSIKVRYPDTIWKIVKFDHVKQTTDGHSCGIFVYKFAEILLDNHIAPFLFFDVTDNAMFTERIRIASDLVRYSGYNPKNACNLCTVEYNCTTDWVGCDACFRWFHLKCLCNTKDRHLSYTEANSTQWQYYCRHCRHSDVSDSKKRKSGWLQAESDDHSDDDDVVIVESSSSVCAPPKSDKALKRQEEMDKKRSLKKIEDAVLQYMKCEDTKEYVYQIYGGLVESWRHVLYQTTAGIERLKRQHEYLGPLENDDLVESVYWKMCNWMPGDSTFYTTMKNSEYILFVWIPEAALYAYTITQNATMEEAKMWWKNGPFYTKAEKKETHEQLLKNAKNISEEDREQYTLLRKIRKDELKEQMGF